MAEHTRTGQHVSLLGYGACALAGSLWGTGFYFGRIALDEMGVESMVLWRFMFACVGVLPALVLHRKRFRLSRPEWRTLLTAAAFGIPVQFLVQFHGLARTTVSHASLMVGAMPVLLAAAAAFFAPKGSHAERLDWLGWLALCGSTVGAALIVLGGSHGAAVRGQPTLIGDLLVVLSLVTALAWILLSKKLMEQHSPPVVTACTILTGTLMLAAWIFGKYFFFSLLQAHGGAGGAFPSAPPVAFPIALQHVTLTAWAALAASGILCTAATTFLWNWGIHHVPASRAGVFLNIEPALGSWLGVQLLGEHLGPYAWVGGGLILTAAILLTSRGGGSEPEILLE